MFGKTGISVVIDKADSDMAVHQTINSVLGQTGLSRFSVSIICEKVSPSQITNGNVKVLSRPRSGDFLMRLRAGDIISKSFLYKGLSYLLLNPEVNSVCPALVLRFVGVEIATAWNEKSLLNGEYGTIVAPNREDTKEIFSTPIYDTCMITGCQTPWHGSFLWENSQFLPCLPALEVEPKNYSGRQKKEEPLTEPYATGAKAKAKRLVKRSRVTSALVRPAVTIRRALIQERRQRNYDSATTKLQVSELLVEEILDLTKKFALAENFSNMNNIDATDASRRQILKVYDEYLQLRTYLRKKQYDYIMVVPWLIHGGADLFAVNYANEIARQFPEKSVLIITTSPLRSTLSTDELGLDDGVDLLNLSVGRAVGLEEDNPYIVNLLYSFINNLRPKMLHVLMSKSGYDMLLKYGTEIRGRGIKIVMSAYNYLVDKSGKWVGYAVEELPRAYRHGDLIATDNVRIIEIWKQSFGIREKDIRLHYQRFHTEKKPVRVGSTSELRVLWAAHVRREKNPEMVVKIARRFPNVQFDCYGAVDPYEWGGKNPLAQYGLKNLHYKGAYQDFFNDINLRRYTAFLYTTLTDGMPNVLVEAALAGLPIIAPRVGGIPGLLSAETGFLVDNSRDVDEFASALRELLDNQDVAVKRAEKLGGEVRSNFSLKNFSKQVRDMLEWGGYEK